MAGLVASLGPEAVLGVHTGAMDEPLGPVARFASEAGARQVDPGSLRVRLDLVGGGYGSLTEAVKSAMVLAARTEGIVLDPVYTGRAMAGLVAAVREGDISPGETTVFVHTGGLPGFFGHEEAVTYAENRLDASQARPQDA
jgi:D-cysteine desulfhydrase